MLKYYGAIGFATEIETSPGVWEEQIIEHNHRGDILRTSVNAQKSENLNDNLVITNRVSIISNPFATENFFKIRYVTWMGVRWSVRSVTVQRPRLVLALGEVYNG